MTIKEFLAIEKMLLPNFPGFVAKGALMFIQPLHHVLSGFHFDPSSFGKRNFFVKAFFMPLCIPTRHLQLTFGHRVTHGGRQRWSADQPQLQAALRSEMLKEVPFLSSLKTPQGLVSALRSFSKPNGSGYVNPHSVEALAYSLINTGQLATAVPLLDALVNHGNTIEASRNEIALRARSIKEMVSKNPDDAKQQLLTWETETIANLGMKQFRPG